MKEMGISIAEIVIGIAKSERDHALRMGDTERAREWNNEVARQNRIITELRNAC